MNRLKHRTAPTSSPRPWLSLLLGASVLIAACTSARVTSDFDRRVYFNHYHTYAWVPRSHEGGHNPLASRFAMESIDAELQKKGFVLASDPATADFEVDFTIGARERLDVNAYPVAYRGPWGWGYGYYGSQVDVRRYREGSLVIDIFDARSHQPVWTGRATKPISRADATDSFEPIRSATTAVLAEFPPLLVQRN